MRIEGPDLVGKHTRCFATPRARAGLGALIAILLLGLCFSCNRSDGAAQDEPVEITLYSEIGGDQILNAIAKEIAEFQSLFPKISVTVTSNAGSWDAGIIGGGNDGELAAARSPEERRQTDDEDSVPTEVRVRQDRMVPWSGQLWVLAVDESALADLASERPDLASALRGGAMGPADWIEMLGVFDSLGRTPIAIGNRHKWPLVLWYQVWIAANISPEAASSFPDVDSIGQDSTFVELRDDLLEWKRLEYFTEETWSRGWADGLRQLDTKEAVLGMVSEAQLSTLAAETRQRLAYLPFPRDPSGGSWSLGSVQFLAVNEAGPHPDAARKLVDYLSSEAVTRRLAGTTGRPFFSWDNAEPPVIISAWVQFANTPEFDRLAAFVEGSK